MESLVDDLLKCLYAKNHFNRYVIPLRCCQTLPLAIRQAVCHESQHLFSREEVGMQFVLIFKILLPLMSISKPSAQSLLNIWYDA